jgi:hypothetical protein
MNNEAINKVITDYAIENANLRLLVANLQEKLEEFEKKSLEGNEE